MCIMISTYRHITNEQNLNIRDYTVTHMNTHPLNPFCTMYSDVRQRVNVLLYKKCSFLEKN